MKMCRSPLLGGVIILFITTCSGMDDLIQNWMYYNAPQNLDDILGPIKNSHEQFTDSNVSALFTPSTSTIFQEPKAPKDQCQPALTQSPGTMPHHVVSHASAGFLNTVEDFMSIGDNNKKVQERNKNLGSFSESLQNSAMGHQRRTLLDSFNKEGAQSEMLVYHKNLIQLPDISVNKGGTSQNDLVLPSLDVSNESLYNRKHINEDHIQYYSSKKRRQKLKKLENLDKFKSNSFFKSNNSVGQEIASEIELISNSHSRGLFSYPRIQSNIETTNNHKPSGSPLSQTTDQTKLLEFNSGVFFHENPSELDRLKIKEIVSIINRTPGPHLLIDISDLKGAYNLFVSECYIRVKGLNVTSNTKKVNNVKSNMKRMKLTRESTAKIMSKKDLWLRFWKEKSGINFETWHLKPSLSLSNTNVEQHFNLFIFYINMITTILVKPSHIPSSENPLGFENNNSDLIQHAVKNYKSVLEKLFSLENQGQLSGTKIFTSVLYQTKKACAVKTLKIVWRTIKLWLESTGNEELLNIIFRNEGCKFVSKTFFDDIFFYSITHLTENISRYYKNS
ncbi:hypothetical protein PGT21_015339 [Puccinia graminis f. sp. tritici]|uniref:Uncharacterized protein n=1 Tax=Puccinia graminis f. sp. tritici TaxID=56615 RepID=A0A5B0NGQ9_PUCGR|nr:hypothetical protein PGT21_015339 [Puccinia graminis f. sp. tritici]KAA1087973.1 hypothetical protein PGTUg99_012021 [Puccinia graminis f. sp. tritici]